MKTLKMEIELTYNGDHMHGIDKDAIEWFFEEIMLEPKEPLLLHSNELGDTVGEVKVLSIEADDKDYHIFISKKQKGETK